ncbi:TPA: hypothetical protein EYP66_00645 [Candidatus Poribacteria bacterium]|nr:hypothetical protein [Candidatus Poribacteria bacterium]
MFRKFGKSKAISLSSIVILAVLSLTIAGCGGCGEKKTVVHSIPDEKTQVQAVSKFNPSDGFDLSAMIDLIKRVKDPKDLEAILNSESGPNNMDLNGDGYRDYAAVEMYGSPPEMGYSVYVYPTDDPNDRVEVCDIQLTQMSDGNVDVYVDGRGYWGGHTYWGVHPMAYSPLFAVTFGWRAPFYVTPWGTVVSYRVNPFPIVTPVVYRSRMAGYARTQPVNRTTITRRTVKRTVRSPNRTTQQQFAQKRSKLDATRQANIQKRGGATSLKQVQQGKRSFEKQDTTKAVGAGGFGKSSTKVSPLKPSQGTSKLKPSQKPKRLTPSKTTTQSTKKPGSFSRQGSSRRSTSSSRPSRSSRRSSSRRSGRGR